METTGREWPTMGKRGEGDVGERVVWEEKEEEKGKGRKEDDRTSLKVIPSKRVDERCHSPSHSKGGHAISLHSHTETSSQRH